MNIFLTAFALPLLLLTGCGHDALEAPDTPPVVREVPANWSQEQQRRQTHKRDYLQEHSVAYDWFTRFAFSETDGVPFILLKLLPIIAPEYWGGQDNFLQVVGLNNDPARPGYPLATGIGISAMARSEKLGNIDYTSFTCAACHIGRVRTPQGELQLIEGGVNSEFNIVQYRVRVYNTLKKVFADETDRGIKNTLLVNAFMAALQKIESTQPHYFYNDYQAKDINFSGNYEQQQIALFKSNAHDTIIKFANAAENEYLSYAALLNKNYDGFQEQSLKGFAGMADATGISATSAYSGLQDNFFSRLFASYILPSSPGISDFMTVWEQDKRKASWDSEHESLINGGGQWNGNIPIPMYRNLAAQLTLGLENNDIRVAAFGVELLAGLPASVYPFDVDVALAEKGQRLFSENCAQCHQPHNGKIYSNLGTNLDRSFVVNWLIRKGGIEGFYQQCSPDTEVEMYGKKFKPCAEFDGVSLQGKKNLIISPSARHHGYNARPLSGIWAQAPFLHNGSVPTLYHLLVPAERPESFIKSRLDYDSKLLGFAWDKQQSFSEGYLFDTSSFPTFSNVGHDRDIEAGDKVFKLDWSDDKPSAMALIEYLKTL